MVLLKDLFLHRDIGEINDSAQANTTRSQKIKLAEIQNRLTLCGVRKLNWRKYKIGLHCAKSNKYFFENLKVTDTAQSRIPRRLTLHRVLLASILCLYVGLS